LASWSWRSAFATRGPPQRDPLKPFGNYVEVETVNSTDSSPILSKVLGGEDYLNLESHFVKGFGDRLILTGIKEARRTRTH
jgi:hypothetical protein